MIVTEQHWQLPTHQQRHRRVCGMKIHMCQLSTLCRHTSKPRRRHTYKDPLPTSQTPANKHSHVHFTTSRSHPPLPPRLPSIVTRSVFLPLRPPFSGLDGHYCRGVVAFIHGHDRRPSPGKGAGKTGRENKHTIRLRSWLPSG